MGQDGDARAFDKPRDPQARLILHGVGGDEGVLGAEATEGAVGIVEMVHRGTEIPRPPREEVSKEARERLGVVEAHFVTCRNSFELGDCACALWRRDGGSAERAMQAKARPKDERVRLSPVASRRWPCEDPP